MQLADEFFQTLLEAIEVKAKEYARAKALETSLDKMLKVTLAFLTKGEMRTSVKAAELDALTHPQYKSAVDKLTKAEEECIIARVEMENAVRQWESWRTLCANERRG
jgi:hypothetical protein